MFKTNEFEKNNSRQKQNGSLPLEAVAEKAAEKTSVQPSEKPNLEDPKFETLAEFELWLDTQLKGLVECFSDFQTKHSLRGYFARK